MPFEEDGEPERTTRKTHQIIQAVAARYLQQLDCQSFIGENRGSKNVKPAYNMVLDPYLQHLDMMWCWHFKEETEKGR